MNPIVDKLIDLLFEDCIENDETRAIREELRANCQEHFADLKAQGATDDEAIHAVVESLSGMKETLAPFARAESTDFTGFADDTHQSAYSFDPALAPIHSVELRRMGRTNLVFSPSEDNLVHLSCTDSEFPYRAAVSQGTLQVEALLSEFSLQEMLGQLFRNLRHAACGASGQPCRARFRGYAFLRRCQRPRAYVCQLPVRLFQR